MLHKQTAGRPSRVPSPPDHSGCSSGASGLGNATNNSRRGTTLPTVGSGCHGCGVQTAGGRRQMADGQPRGQTSQEPGEMFPALDTYFHDINQPPHHAEMTHQIPPLNIPPSSQNVNVHVIDTTVKIDGPADFFLKPRLGNMDRLVANAFTFLIEHPITKQKVVFDLGVRKDANELSSPFWKGFRENFVIDVEKDVAEILQDNSVDLASIEAIIWSHCHADHTGDPSTFPPSVDLVFGPGAPAARLPGYPTNQKSSLFEADYQGRKLVEITQDRFDLQIGEFRAFDYFGDGSFYLLDVPGHDIGHVCGLARTTANGTASEDDSFVLMGADTCHHAGQMRPSEFLPLPSRIQPHEKDLDVMPAPFASTCLQKIHPKGPLYHSCPFYEVGVLENGFSMSESPEETGQSIKKMMPFDAAPNVLLVLAHDVTLQDTVNLFPAKVNGWEETELKDETRWRFLRDWSTALSDDMYT